MCIACHPLSTLLVSGGFDETIRLWDMQRGTCHREIAAHSEAVTSLDFCADGTMIASSSYDGLIRLWDTNAGLCLRTLQHTDQAPVGSVQFSPSSLHLLASSLDHVVRLWDIANARVVKSYTSHKNAQYAGTSLFVLDGTHARVVCGSEDHCVYVWDVQTKEVVCQLAAHRDVVSCVAVHPTRPLLASGSLAQDASVALWCAPHSTIT
jgi:hypothetical protein